MASVRRSAFLSLSLVALLASASCGSSASSSDNPPSDLSPAAAAKWSAYCDYRAACQTTSPCPTTACLARIAEQGPLIEFVDCQVAQTCDVSDDACIAGAGTTDAERQDFAARCVAALSTPPSLDCLLTWPEPAICTIVADPIIRKEFMRAVDACLTLPCGEVKACIDAATEPLNCW